MVPSVLSLENPLSDSYTFNRTLPRYSMLLSTILSILLCDLVMVSLLYVLVTIIRFVLESIGFAYVTALVTNTLRRETVTKSYRTSNEIVD